jgi:hypothetical protein
VNATMPSANSVMTRRDRITEVKNCPQCRERVTSELIAAAASVGIARKRSTQSMLLAYLLNYHGLDHQELP